MPTLRNLTVNVTDAHHRPLPEWGVQHFGGASLSTCYVQSETDQTFCVTVEARIPFEGFDGGGDAQLKEDPDGSDRVSKVKRCKRETETENLAVRGTFDFLARKATISRLVEGVEKLLSDFEERKVAERSTLGACRS
ncbi:hypothetical protein LTR28_002627 [Elasticomyces elasticus]|nr:hypothetical protein LTR28_002627 [Elasticomyces elasticus]